MHKQHEKTKIYRKFRQDQKKEVTNNQESKEISNNKIEKYEKIQKMIEEYDKKLGVEYTGNSNPNLRKKQVNFLNKC